ncbi:unnamed protein product [Lepeophtheirus salmonis]|uniref:(salmon louse) hypothetical protein n=1 Tax=Lepeophtheirus salmonis TaxID=72036 RepID=A0A7R8H280_LEPSM|nr:unnamed protein product [Lepeophtheirus salmonis]CAF2809080.1 unnamed protein product [Lepeophtheirus salmonis]
MNYPDKEDPEVLKALLPSLLTLPDGKSVIDLEYLRQKNEGGDERSIVIKRIYPGELPKKQNEDVLVDFIESVRREVIFYKDFLSHTEDSIAHLIPKIYEILTSYNENEVVRDPMSMNTMNEQEAKVVLKNVAEFHAFYWNRLPKKAERGSFWVLERRLTTGELEETEVKRSWTALLNRLPMIRQECSNLTGLENLASILCSKALELDKFIQEGCVTRIHGDLKGWNLFLPTEEALLIDMQWTGKGHPLQASDSSCLPQMNNLVDYYIEELSKYLGDKSLNYSTLRSQFDLVWCDYVRVIVTGIWKKNSLFKAWSPIRKKLDQA